MPWSLPRRLALALLIPLLLLAPIAQADTARQLAVASFTVARGNGGPIVEVRFGKSVTGRFLLDTGSYECLMTDSFAKKLGYQPTPHQTSMLEYLFDVSLAPPDYFDAPAVAVGDLRVPKVPFRVVSRHGLPDIGGQPIDGTLGGTLLSRFALLLDYPRHTMVWIHPGGLDDASVARLGLDPKSAIGMQQELSYWMGIKVNHYSAPVRLHAAGSEVPDRLFLDTGSPLSSISSETARKLNLTLTGIQPYQFLFQGPDFACKAPIPEFRLGTQTLPDVAVIYPSHRGASMVSLLGANVLGGCIALFDFGPHRFYLKPLLPNVLSGPLPPLDPLRVDWKRLAEAPNRVTPYELLDQGLKPGEYDGPALRASRLKLAMAGAAPDAAQAVRLGVLLQEAGDMGAARTARTQAVDLCRADAEAHPEDVERAGRWVSALTCAGQDDAAVARAQKDVGRWPQSAPAWCAQGEAQEWQAAHALLADWNQPVTDKEALTPLPELIRLPGKPTAQARARIESLRRQARLSYGRAVSLAPRDPANYRQRARFWTLDRWLIVMLEDADAGGHALSGDAALAGELSDYQDEARHGQDDPDVLSRAAVMDAAFPVFHDKDWLRGALQGTGQSVSGGSLVSAKSAALRLQTLTQDPNKAHTAAAWSALGAAQDAQDDEAGAEASWRKALALDGVRADAWGGLARLLLTQDRENDLAEALMAQFARPDAPSGEQALPLRLLLAATLRDMNIADDAEAQARLALQSAPDCGEANRMLAGLLLAHGRSETAALAEAAACLARADAAYGPGASGPVASSLQTMQAVLTSLNGDPTQGRRLLLDLLHAEPESTEAREALAALTLPAP